MTARASLVRILLAPAILRELRMQLLTVSIAADLELVEQAYPNGDIVVRLRYREKPERGEIILGAYHQAHNVT